MNIETLNLDFSKQLVINPNDMAWISSPSEGVHRKQFEREQAESGRVTSLVRFDPGASFETHNHPMGEEIMVLQGTFSDENGDYPAGSYLRHPPGTFHAPFSEDGCVIFVKLDHFLETDTKSVVIREDERQWNQGIGNLQVASLHEHLGEHTALVKWPKGEHFQPHKHWGGEEILVLDGVFSDEHGDYPKGSWIRSPHLSQHDPYTDVTTLILVKVGHLPDVVSNIK